MLECILFCIPFNKTRGGGVLLAIKSDISSYSLNSSYFEAAFPNIDFLMCKCILPYGLSLIVAVIYIPPYVTPQEYELFFESLEQCEYLQSKRVIILGDFNAPHYEAHDNNDIKARQIGTFMNFFNFEQYNNIRNAGNILDLIFSNFKCSVVHDLVPIIPEDAYHPALIINLFNLGSNIPQNVPNCLLKAYNFKRADFLSLYDSLLSTDWTDLDSYTDVNIAVAEFYNRLYEQLDMYVPLRKNFKRKFPVWYTSEIITDIKYKSLMRSKYKKTGDPWYNIEFTNIRRMIKVKCKSAFDRYILSVQEAINSDSGKFWSFINQKNRESRIPGAIHWRGAWYEKPQDIVNAFACYFESVFLPNENEIDLVLRNACQLFDSVDISLASVTDSEIQHAAKKLKNKLTAGPDGIPSFMVKDCMGALMVPLKYVFNLALKTLTFPESWRKTRVCPVFKSNERSDVGNYRPISILNNFSKLFEVILYNRIYTQVRGILSTRQHGFIDGRSTVTNLGVYANFTEKILDAGGQVDVVYTDFSKAFDRISHSVLLQKLWRMGFSVAACSLFSSYLGGRSQSVYYNGYISDSYTATSGVPQGSNLGPLLFLLYINDLCDTLNCGRLLFADDLKLYAPVSCVQDCELLQAELCVLEDWCKHNKLDLNISKCKIMSVTRKNHIITYEYSLGMSTLGRTNSVRDLGVVFDNKMNFSNHINNVTLEANRLYGFIVRNCRSFNGERSLILLYESYVRSKLEYASLVWSPYYSCYKLMLERVQKRFLKYLSYKVDGIYPIRGIEYSLLLERFNFRSLEARRECSSVVFLYRLLHGVIDCPQLLSEVAILVPRINSRNTATFVCSRARTNLRLIEPINVMCNNFNLISNECDIFADTENRIRSICVDHFT